MTRVRMIKQWQIESLNKNKRYSNYNKHNAARNMYGSDDKDMC